MTKIIEHLKVLRPECPIFPIFVLYYLQISTLPIDISRDFGERECQWINKPPRRSLGPVFQVSSHMFSLPAGRQQKVTLRFTNRQEAELSRALAKHHRIFAEAFAYAQNAQGNATVLTAGKQVFIRS